MFPLIQIAFEVADVSDPLIQPQRLEKPGKAVHRLDIPASVERRAFGGGHFLRFEPNADEGEAVTEEGTLGRLIPARVFPDKGATAFDGLYNGNPGVAVLPESRDKFLGQGNGFIARLGLFLDCVRFHLGSSFTPQTLAVT